MIIGPRTSMGLTLVEVLIAISIIGIAFVALSMSQVSNLKVIRASQQASIATQTANEALEVLIQRVLADYVAFQACPGAERCSGSYPEGQYAVDYNIVRGSGYALEGLIRIDIRVDGPAEAELHHFVSCMDVSPPPTVANPGLCR